MADTKSSSQLEFIITSYGSEQAANAFNKVDKAMSNVAKQMEMHQGLHRNSEASVKQAVVQGKALTDTSKALALEKSREGKEFLNSNDKLSQAQARYNNLILTGNKLKDSVVEQNAKYKNFRSTILETPKALADLEIAQKNAFNAKSVEDIGKAYWKLDQAQRSFAVAEAKDEKRIEGHQREKAILDSKTGAYKQNINEQKKQLEVIGNLTTRQQEAARAFANSNKEQIKSIPNTKSQTQELSKYYNNLSNIYGLEQEGLLTKKETAKLVEKEGVRAIKSGVVDSDVSNLTRESQNISRSIAQEEIQNKKTLIDENKKVKEAEIFNKKEIANEARIQGLYDREEIKMKKASLGEYSRQSLDIQRRESQNQITRQQALKEYGALGKKFDKLGLINPEVTERTKKFNQELLSMNASMINNMANMAKWAIGWTLLYTAINSVKMAFMSVINTSIEFDKVASMFASIMGSSVQESKKFLMSGLDIGIKYGKSFTEMSNAMELWVRQGKSVEETLNLTKQSLMLAAIGAIDDAAATNMLTSIMGEFNLQAEDSARIVDILSLLDKKYAISTAELGNSLKVVGPVAKDFGLSLEETAGILTAVISTTRIGASQVGNAMKTIFTRVRRPEVIKDLYEIAGVISRTDTGFADLGTVLEQLNRRWDSLTESEREYLSENIAGIRQTSQFRALMNSFGEAQKATNLAFLSAGSAIQSFSAISQSTAFKIKATQSEISKLSIQIGEQGLGAAVSSTLSTFQNLFSLLRSISGLIGFLSFGGKWILEPVIITAGVIGIVAGFKKLIDIIKAATIAQKGFNLASKANAIGLGLGIVSTVWDMAAQGRRKQLEEENRLADLQISQALKVKQLQERLSKATPEDRALFKTYAEASKSKIEIDKKLEESINKTGYALNKESEAWSKIKSIKEDLSSGDIKRVQRASKEIEAIPDYYRSTGKTTEKDIMQGSFLATMKRQLVELLPEYAKFAQISEDVSKIDFSSKTPESKLRKSYDQLVLLTDQHDTFVKSLDMANEVYKANIDTQRAYIENQLGLFPSLNEKLDNINKKYALNNKEIEIYNNSISAMKSSNVTFIEDTTKQRKDKSGKVLPSFRDTLKGFSDLSPNAKLATETLNAFIKSTIDGNVTSEQYSKTIKNLSAILGENTDVTGEFGVSKKDVATILIKTLESWQKENVSLEEAKKRVQELTLEQKSLVKSQNDLISNDFLARQQESIRNLNKINDINRNGIGLQRALNDAQLSTYPTFKQFQDDIRTKQKLNGDEIKWLGTQIDTTKAKIISSINAFSKLKSKDDGMSWTEKLDLLKGQGQDYQKASDSLNTFVASAKNGSVDLLAYNNLVSSLTSIIQENSEPTDAVAQRHKELASNILSSLKTFEDYQNIINLSSNEIRELEKSQKALTQSEKDAIMNLNLMDISLRKSTGSMTEWQASIANTIEKLKATGDLIHLGNIENMSMEGKKAMQDLTLEWNGMVEGIATSLESPMVTAVDQMVSKFARGMSDMEDIGFEFAKSFADIWQKMWVEDLVKSFHDTTKQLAEGVNKYRNTETIGGMQGASYQNMNIEAANKASKSILSKTWDATKSVSSSIWSGMTSLGSSLSGPYGFGDRNKPDRDFKSEVGSKLNSAFPSYKQQQELFGGGEGVNANNFTVPVGFTDITAGNQAMFEKNKQNSKESAEVYAKLMQDTAPLIGTLIGRSFAKEGTKESAAMGTQIGGMIGSIWGPAGTIIGSAIGGALGSLIPDQKKNDEKTVTTLEKISETLQVSKAELNIVNRNLVGLRQNPITPQGIREAFWMRTGSMSFASGGTVPNTGLALVHQGETVLKKGQSSMNIEKIEIRIDGAGKNSKEIAQEVANALSLSAMSLYRG